MIKKLEALGNDLEEISKKAIDNTLPILEKSVEKNLDRYIHNSKNSTGELKKSIYQRKAKKNNKTGDVKGAIAFKGTRYKNKNKTKESAVRNGLIAGVLEYGKKGQPPRPFLRIAAAESEQEVTNAIRDVFNQEIEKRGL